MFAPTQLLQLFPLIDETCMVYDFFFFENGVLTSTCLQCVVCQ